MRVLLLLLLSLAWAEEHLEGEEEAAAMFARADTDNNGFLDKDEMVAWIQSEDTGMASEEVDEEAHTALTTFDHNKDQKLSKEEFVEAILAMEDEKEEQDDHEADEDEEHEMKEHEH
mmetsp:Transcript_101940/g.243025  ORF Transcript_101940/g.243025 Transcript_101940/m.243025 type:complete len:117 (-) Transcript_101940:53-403(-)